MPDMDRQELKEAVLNVLKQHDDYENCIKKEALWSTVTGELIIPKRRNDQTRPLRSIIESLQKDGHPICHRSGIYGGFFYSKEHKYVIKQAHRHHKCAMTHLRRKKHLLRINDKEVLKQVELDLKQ